MSVATSFTCQLCPASATAGNLHAGRSEHRVKELPAATVRLLHVKPYQAVVKSLQVYSRHEDAFRWMGLGAVVADKQGSTSLCAQMRQRETC